MSQKPARQARRRASGPDLKVSPLLAYGEGASADSWKTPTPFVAGCLAVSAMLHAATRERSSRHRQQLLDRATDQIVSLQEPGRAWVGSELDTDEQRSQLKPFFAAAERLILVENAPHAVAAHMLDSLAALVPSETLDAGRVMSTRVMFGYGDVHMDLRTELSRQVVRLGFRLRSHELLTRGWAHLLARAFARGNLPQALVAGRRTRRHALADGDRRLVASSLALDGIMAGMQGDVANSIEALWEAFQLTDHPTLRAQLLANLGETLYRAGRFREARAARAMNLLSPTGYYGYVSLGGYAACCAALGDVDGVKWAAGQAMLVRSSETPSRQLAQGLMGCADACGDVGLVDLAKALYERGRAMADTYGFHDLQFRADPSVPRPRTTPHPLEGRVLTTLDSIAMLAPDGVPADAVLTW